MGLSTIFPIVPQLQNIRRWSIEENQNILLRSIISTNSLLCVRWVRGCACDTSARQSGSKAGSGRRGAPSPAKTLAVNTIIVIICHDTHANNMKTFDWKPDIIIGETRNYFALFLIFHFPYQISIHCQVELWNNPQSEDCHLQIGKQSTRRRISGVLSDQSERMKECRICTWSPMCVVKCTCIHL